MAMGSAPSRDDIYNELSGSSYSGGNSLKDMYDYIFGNTNYSRDDFGGYGNPEVGNLTEDSTGENSVTATVSMNNYGNLSCNFVARYRVDGNSSWNYDFNLGSASSGDQQFTLSGLDDGTTYEIEYGAYNDFNDADIPQNVVWSSMIHATTESAGWTQDSAHFNGETVDDAYYIDNNDGTYDIRIEWTPSQVPAQATGLYLSTGTGSTYYDEGSGFDWSDGFVRLTGFSNDNSSSVAYADDPEMKYGDWFNFGGFS